MKQFTLWKISVTTIPDAEDAVAEWLGTVFAQPASSYTDADTRQTNVSVYLRDRPDWTLARREELAASLDRTVRSVLELGSGSITLRRIPRQDWAESWKLHFKPLVIGSALLLKPSWSRRRPRKGQAVVVLDPGLSFGTGRHPTTAFCLQQLVAQRRPGEAQSCLDVGTGSGILAIAAAKLGYGPVDALDFDPESIRVARANARRNGVSSTIRFQGRDLTTMSRQSTTKYSLLCANLVSTLLVAEQERLLARLRPGGVLMVAGILKAEFAAVQRSLEGAGLRLITGQTENEWRSGAFAWR